MLKIDREVIIMERIAIITDSDSNISLEEGKKLEIKLLFLVM